MTATTQTLADFLLARIAEDEEMADRSVQVGDKGAALITFRLDHLVGAPESPPIMLIHPARVLAECAAKRAIVELEDDEAADSPPYYSALQDVLRALASVYADHAEFREEWTL